MERDQPDETFPRRRVLEGGGLAALGALAGCVGRAAENAGSHPTATQTAASDEEDPTTVRAQQAPEQLVYWILPDKRRLSEKVFGTPEHPKSLVEPVIERAKKPAIKELLHRFPILVGLPLDKRAVNEAGTKFTHSTIPTPFGDRGEVVDGEFDLTYVDNQERDTPKKPTKTDDEVELHSVSFTDPQLNDYKVQLKQTFQPPIPGYKTGGGVFTNRYHHGLTGTGSPLMPKVYTWGASYSIGNVVANGEVVDKRKVIHWMTTQTVRTENYRLATEEQLPLAPDETIAGQIHHTHLIVFPVTITKQGKPEYDPVDIPFDAPGEMKQPFIHVMYEEDEVKAPFEPPEQITKPFQQTETRVDGQAADGILVKGSEFYFDPHRVTVTEGEQVTITFQNVGSVAHNFTIDTLGIRTETIQPGKKASVTFTPEHAGVYGFWCGVPGHQDAGMQGRLVVEESGGDSGQHEHS